MRESYVSQRNGANGDPLSLPESEAFLVKIEREREQTERVLETLPTLSAIVTAADQKTFATLQRALERCAARVALEVKEFESIRGTRFLPIVSERISSRRTELLLSTNVIEDLIQRADSLSLSLKTLPSSVEILKAIQTKELLRTFTDLRQAFWRKLYVVPIVQNTAMESIASVVIGGKQVVSVLHTCSANGADDAGRRARVVEVQSRLLAMQDRIGDRRPTARERIAIAALLVEVPLDPEEANDLLKRCCVKQERLEELEIGILCSHKSFKAAEKAQDVRYAEWRQLADELGGGALQARALIQELTSLYEPYLRVKQYIALSNHRYVCSMVIKQERFKALRDDLMQDGMIGMMRAIEKFDIDRGLLLLTYATHWIFQATSRQYEKLNQIVALPAYQNKVLGQLRKQLADDEHQSDQDLADALGSDVEEIRYLRPLLNPVASVDGRRDGQGGFTSAEILADPRSENVDRNLDREAQSESVRAALRALTERESRVLILRFGLEGEPPKTLSEIGTILGVSRERVRQVQDAALLALRVGDSNQVLADMLRQERAWPA